MDGAVDPRLGALLRQRLARRDRPTDTHYTLEISAFWEDDFLDAVRAGVRRKVRLGGLRSAGRVALALELPPPMKPYVVAHLTGPSARIVVPEAAVVAVRRDDLRVEPSPSLGPARAPFPARAARIGLHEWLGFRVGTLSFVCRFVHRDGAPRNRWDWLRTYLAPTDID